MLTLSQKIRLILCRVSDPVFSPRQKVNIEARGGCTALRLRRQYWMILNIFKYNVCRVWQTVFTTEDLAKLLREKYGMSNARIIVNSLFELVLISFFSEWHVR